MAIMGLGNGCQMTDDCLPCSHLRHAADDEGPARAAEVTIPLDALDAVAGLPCLRRENPVGLLPLLIPIVESDCRPVPHRLRKQRHPARVGTFLFYRR